eukprot:CAMPEP_0185769624 /NCGR_PEP_ID=MMETSP1174-20130828/55055_1 /TAXON_ID=35687 /ORGANISM="Dictyocha speculum, Strain CCMP1381" /LENGTH=465 /DNA_ID=CAMNT_0028454763 /DNA_START=6 /DNA_END=1400 /DNA_ORIENTATION=+
MKASGSTTSLSPMWIFNAAMLSQPMDLSTLVTLSRDNPISIVQENGLMEKMISKVLNVKDSKLIDKDARLDVLLVLANVARTNDDECKAKVRMALQSVSSWFDTYLKQEEGDGKHEVDDSDEEDYVEEPELHKTMLLVLARAYNYELKTEDLLELAGGNRTLALRSVVSLLEDGETILSEIKKRRSADVAQQAQWEQKFAVIRHEKKLVLQMCQLLLGFTRPDTYFASLDEGYYFMEAGLELPEYTIEKFSVELDALMEITTESRLVESLAIAMNHSIFSNGRVLDVPDHQAVTAIHGFLQNLYLFATVNTEQFRSYLLADTLLVPHLVLPYFERCVYHAAVMSRRAESNREILSDFAGLADLPSDLMDEVSSMSLDYPELIQGMEATLRTLIIISFRAPRTRLMFQLLLRINPSASLLRMKSFLARHDYLFSLLLLLNVNMGAFDMSPKAAEMEGSEKSGTGGG